MASKADFHTHSTASDGVLTPTQLVDLAASRGVRYLVLTDHDSLEGIAEARAAAAKHPGLKLIPGVELSTDIPGTEVHMLGYFVDPEDRELQRHLAEFRAARLDRGRRMVERLAELGMPIAWERVREIAGDAAVGRPHVAQALLEKGYVASIQEAFEKWIGRSGPAYAERERMTPAAAVRFIVDAGGLAVFAHPGYTENAESLLPELKAAGLAGLEVYYRDYDDTKIAALEDLARKYGLIPTGGSDYHGLNNPGERLPGDIPFPDAAVDYFLEEACTRLGARARSVV
jgi:hypothetical protein